MREPVDPQNIYEDYISNRLSKVETAEKLIMIIENGNLSFQIESSINLLGKLALPTNEVFKVLENCLITIPYPIIRALTAKILLEMFPERSIEPLMWVIVNDCTPYSLYSMYDLFGWSEDPLFEGIKKELFKKIELRVQNRVREGIIYEEAIILTLFNEILPELVNLNENPDAGYNLGAYYRTDDDGHIVNFFVFPTDEEHIYFLPENIYRLRHLEELGMVRCCLDTIPESIGKLKSLRILNLDYNLIVNLPQSIGSLDSLEELSLSNNYIETLPESISSLKSLKRLYIDENNIEFIPEALKLKILY